jgi:hypothetical protein
MTRYAMIFYLTRALTPEESQRRNVEIPVWAKQVREMGVTLDPRSFEKAIFSSPSQEDGGASRNETDIRAFSNIVFLDSSSEEQAIQIAKIHPALRYGATVEVRSWTPPPATPARP